MQNKEMKKVLSAFIILAIFSGNLIHGQTTLAFCASIDADGYCHFNNTKFIAAQDSSSAKIFIELKGDGILNTPKVTYKIYSIDGTGNEKMLDFFEQIIQPDWMFAWMPYHFSSGGRYHVKVFNDANQLMCSKSFELLDWE